MGIIRLPDSFGKYSVSGLAEPEVAISAFSTFRAYLPCFCGGRLPFAVMSLQPFRKIETVSIESNSVSVFTTAAKSCCRRFSKKRTLPDISEDMPTRFPLPTGERL